MKPSVVDFEACIRVGLGGAEAFRQLQELAAGKLTDLLRGKIFTLEAENRYLDGELIRTTHDVRTYRDQILVSYSEDNRSLKEELKKLEGVQKQLGAANAKVKEQSKSIDEVSQLKADLQSLLGRIAAAEAEKEENAKLIE